MLAILVVPLAILEALPSASSPCDSAWRGFHRVWSEVAEAPIGYGEESLRLRQAFDRLRSQGDPRSTRCVAIERTAQALTEEYICLESSNPSCGGERMDSLVGEVVRIGEPDLLRVVQPLSWNLLPVIDSLLLRKSPRVRDLQTVLRRSALVYGPRPYLVDVCASRPFLGEPKVWEHCANFVFEVRGFPGWKAYRETLRRNARDSATRAQIDRIEPLGKVWLRESLHGDVSMVGSGTPDRHP